MDCGIRVELQQKLIMTPQLRQAIAILQLSSLELAAMVEKEILENPALEVDDTQAQNEEQNAEPLTKYTQLAEYLNNEMRYESRYCDSDCVSYEFQTDDTISLAEHLELQLDLVNLDYTMHEIGLFLIGCIDDNGYLQISVEEAARLMKKPEHLVDKALAVIQGFDPEGVGARSLSECLAIQIRQRNINDELSEIIVERYLEEVSKGQIKAIADKLGCTPHDVQMAVDFIRTLNPKPGQAYGKSRSDYILPDIIVEKINGQYVILVNDCMVPRLTISSAFSRLARECDIETRRFVEERMNAAIWVVKSIEQRRQTLYKVMQSIIEMQQAFFEYGPKYLKPLTMKKVADKNGVHESTVSRAIAGKYVATPYGTFSLRSFFPAGLIGDDGDDVAVSAVKTEIKQIIASEDSENPLSDQEITDIIKQKGISVSRRTVAKYREELGIASSSKRRRY